MLLLLTFFLAQRLQYIFHAVFLLAMGLAPLLYYLGFVSLNIRDLIALKYIITLVIVMSGRELIRHGMKERQKGLKQISIVMGIAIIVATAIPALATFGSITFRFPEYPFVIDSILYIAGAAMLAIGTLVAGE